MKKPKSVKGYMCLVDFNYHIDGDWNGTVIYPSLKSLRHERKCVRGCGIAQVKVVFDRCVQKESPKP